MTYTWQPTQIFPSIVEGRDGNDVFIGGITQYLAHEGVRYSFADNVFEDLEVAKNALIKQYEDKK